MTSSTSRAVLVPITGTTTLYEGANLATYWRLNRLANGNWARSDADIGAVFTTYPQSVFQPNSSDSDPLLLRLPGQ